MNRLLAVPSAARILAEKFDSQVDIAERATLNLDFPYQLFTPEKYEPKYRYPLFIWLHSDDSSERELESVMESMTTQNFIGISLRGVAATSGPRNTFSWKTDATSLALTEEMIFEAANECIDKLSVNPENVFLAGYGTGGTLASRIGLRYPDRFAGTVSVNGEFPNQPKGLSKWKAARDLPILWMNGTESTDCGVDALIRMLKLAYPAGLTVHPVQFADNGGLCTERLATANRFMMQLVTGQPVCLAEPADSSI
jgi:phospholipase/carboxylesterase